MRLLRIASMVAAATSVTLLAGTPAVADPPPTNPNVSVYTFDCHRGSESLAFQAVAISQNNSIAGHLLDGQGTVVFTRIEFRGEVLFEKPGQSGRADVWTCTVAEEVPGVIFDVVLTPRG
jgi:hypothetical protein